MATSSVEICNSALIKIGAERITSLSDDNQRAILCNEQYAKLRDELLLSHPWHFAKTRATPAVDVTAPEYEWDYRFALPADCLRILSLDIEEFNGKWVEESEYILCNSDVISMLYIKQVTDTTLFPPTFSEALACKIAADISYALTQNATLQKTMYDVAKEKIADARSFDSQATGNVVQARGNTWANSRR